MTYCVSFLSLFNVNQNVNILLSVAFVDIDVL